MSTVQPPTDNLPLDLGTKLYFALGASATGTFSMGIAYFSVIYSNAALGMPATIVGSALATALLVDAVSDLVVGVWSDRTKNAMRPTASLHACRRAAFGVALLAVLESARVDTRFRSDCLLVSLHSEYDNAIGDHPARRSTHGSRAGANRRL